LAEVVWTGEALGWLREIHDFMAEVNPAAAMRVAFAERHADRRISLREIALSHRVAGRIACGKALIAQRLGEAEGASLMESRHLPGSMLSFQP